MVTNESAKRKYVVKLSAEERERLVTLSLSSRLNQLLTAAISRTRSPADVIGFLRDYARGLGDWLDRGAIWIYGTLAALMFGTCYRAIASFTIEADESQSPIRKLLSNTSML
jgi:hypothetical protein